MPYKLVHFDAPKDMTLPVFSSLPEGFVEERDVLLTVNRIAQNGMFPRSFMYHCHWCDGWIQGEPNEFKVNTLESEHLAGRRGIEYYCCRCGREIGFSGMMS